MAALGDIVGHFDDLTVRLDQVWDKGKLSLEYKGLLKLLYDFTQIEGFSGSKSLPELIVNEFDVEQLWQELELQNSSFLPNVIEKAAKLLVSREVSDIPVQMGFQKSKSRPLEIPRQMVVPRDLAEPAIAESDDDDEVFDESYEDLQTIDEDSDDDDDDDDEDIDMFNSEDDKSERSKIMYDDFFKPPGGEEELLSEIQANQEENHSGNDLASNCGDAFEQLLNESGDNIQASSSSERPNEEMQSKMANYDPESEEEMSTFQKRQMRLGNKITKMQAKALAQKSWQLSGEVAADSRPVNSLLEEAVEFETTQRPAPVMTEAATDKLEDIIRKRIKDKAYDDIEKKVKPVSAPAELKKKAVLNQEKSKQSLAEIYESEYLQQKQNTLSEQMEQEIENPEHVELKKRMTKLFTQLDTLSDMYFVTRPQEPQLKLVSNTPAATTEDVGPTVQSDSAALAPEEAAPGFNKELISKEEKTDTDKKRERRKKKERQALRNKWKSAFCDRPLPKQYSAEISALRAKTLPTLSDKVSTTSKDFFEKLQVLQSTPGASSPKKTSKSDGKRTAKRIKL